MDRAPRLSQHDRPARVLLVVVIAAVLVVVGGVALLLGHRAAREAGAPTATSPGGSSASVDPRDPSLSLTVDAARKERAAQITSTFENSTLDLQYGFAEDIGDGRGITAGRAGFTSGTGDLLLMVRRYTELEPGNVLAKYIPALEKVDGSDSTAGLDGFTAAWAQAAKDPAQRRLQDDVVDELYFRPAMRMAEELGIRTPLGQAILWDTMIQHGSGGRNGTEAIIQDTLDEVGPVDGDEAAWLDAFLDARLHHLDRAYRDAENDADASSQSRIDALRSLVDSGNLAMNLPMEWEVYGTTFRLPED
ncbi:chitosanase [Georgenia thermotolerans]|uniref:Chitosanase n=1 Tax=Georgenia thermotolerans TaxID=527326 RepID=A0A7J5UQ32_9MICO|nr:chitosanase [Georgenia thermotolerans]KAE8764459.1 chitosanase [Georgenia thermotolerans]